MRRRGNVLACSADHCAPLGHRWLNAQAEEAQRRTNQDGRRYAERSEDDQRRDRVQQDVASQDDTIRRSTRERMSRPSSSVPRRWRRTAESIDDVLRTPVVRRDDFAQRREHQHQHNDQQAENRRPVPHEATPQRSSGQQRHDM